MKKFLIFWFIIIGILSCTKETVLVKKTEYSFGYFPLKSGMERIYKYTRIQIDLPADIQDTTVWYIRETVADTVIDTLDYTLYRLVRERRFADTLSWEPLTVWGIRKYDRKLVRVEENVPYFILNFPEKVNNTWDGNMYNTLDEELYKYSSLLTIDTVQNTVYDAVTVITQQYFKSLYTYQFKEERYSYNVGMILKTKIDVESQPTDMPLFFDISLPIEQRITKGTIETYELISSNIPEL